MMCALVFSSALVDSLEENIRVSRRLILVYTASTFTGYHEANDDSGSGGGSATVTMKSCSDRPHPSINTYSSMSQRDGHSLSSQTPPGHTVPGHKSEGQQSSECQLSFECQLAMHRALLEESIKVGTPPGVSGMQAMLLSSQSCRD